MRDVILHGDALALLKTLESESVQCVVTSPPYFGLRDYGSAGQIGLEETPEAYVAALVEVFREAKRVLRRDGVLWLNLGDSYGSGEIGRHDSVQGRMIDGKRVTSKATERQQRGKTSAKQLLGMPWRVAFALQADGWILRSDVIWHKPNCMPESVRDRPTKSHEYMFLFAKSERYFYDADAIKENASTDNHGGNPLKLRALGNQQIKQISLQDTTMSRLGQSAVQLGQAGRNKRTVWSIATQPYAEAHFATFPPALIEPCILAGSSPQACEVCGAPWERVSEQIASIAARKSYHGQGIVPAHRGGSDRPGGYYPASPLTTGWQPTCKCDNNGSAQCVILDPFMGAGTVGLVAAQHGRHYLGIELNAEYIALAEKRIADARKPKRAKILTLPAGLEQPTLWQEVV